MTTFIVTLMQQQPQCYPCGTAFDAATPGGGIMLILILLVFGWAMSRFAGVGFFIAILIGLLAFMANVMAQ